MVLHRQLLETCHQKSFLILIIQICLLLEDNNEALFFYI